MATQTLTSDPFQIKSDQLPGLTRPLNFKTVTTFENDTNGNIVEGTKKTILQYQVTPGGVFQAAATSTEGGKPGSWKLINAANSNTPILGASAIKSLQTPNGVLNQATQGSVTTAATKAKLKPEQTKVLSDAAKNKGSSDPNRGGGDPNNEALRKDLQSTNKNTRVSFPKDLRYPRTLKSEYQDVIVFNMLKYEPKKLQEGGVAQLGSFGPRSDYTKRTIGNVILPIPSGISDSNSVNWQSDEMTSAKKALADLASAGITGGMEGLIKETEEKAQGVSQNSTAIGQGLAASFMEQAVGVRNLLSRTQGAVQNPNMELLFMGPQLRSFNFNFKLSARSKEEAQDIRSIIRFFKQGMAPQRTESQLFLKAPHTFQLEYKHVNKKHNYLNKFKECALLSFSVDYTPEGQYATFINGEMVSYGITMQFQELEPIFNEDYGNVENSVDTEIGY